MIIREDLPVDHKAIFDLTAAAFAPMPFSNGSEPRIIDKLREDGDMTLSLVAVDAEEVVGQITFSPVTLSNTTGTWIGLGPVAVLPHRQKQSIGSALINEGLARMKASGADGCVLIGNPNYYSRFGFRSHEDLSYGDLPTGYVQYLRFKAELPRGVITYCRAFEEG